jgi:hypothetical protein
MVKTWIGISSIKTNEWTVDLSLKCWWTMMTSAANPNCKAMKSLTMLVSWTIWKEKNARGLQQQSGTYYHLTRHH